MHLNKYRVWCPDILNEEEDDAQTISAHSLEEAVEAWAENWDHGSAECDICSGRHAPIVHVRSGDGIERQYRVSGEAVPVYSAVFVSDVD